MAWRPLFFFYSTKRLRNLHRMALGDLGLDLYLFPGLGRVPPRRYFVHLAPLHLPSMNEKARTNDFVIRSPIGAAWACCAAAARS